MSHLLQPRMVIGARSFSTFHLCGAAGLILSLALTAALVLRLGLSLPILAAMAAAAVGAFLTLAMLTKIATGHESITYYHHHIAALVSAAGIALLSGGPVLSYLDIAVLGIGLFLACGRVGCLMVGCCHGRPSERGIRYRAEHSTQGFTSLLVGVPLVPVQALESLWVVTIVAAGAAWIWGGAAPGAALAAYTAWYASGRFFLEFLRGDSARPYLLGFSEAQWTSAILLAALVLTGASGVIPASIWHMAALATVAGVMITVALLRSLGYMSLGPKHVEELAWAVRRCLEEKRGEHDIVVARTSFGLKVSAGRAPSGSSTVVHYSLSCETGALSERTARSLARWILRLRHGHCEARFMRGGQGVFHLLVDMRSPLTGAPV
jgi:hypothetical protein